MAHFAEISLSKPTKNKPATVIRVVAVDDESILDENGEESEAIGVANLKAQLGGNWVQTSYTGSMRYAPAAAGGLYNGKAFYEVQPFPSWTLDSNYVWQAPTEIPDDSKIGRAYTWNETKKTWDDTPDYPSWTWDPDFSFTDDNGVVYDIPSYRPPVEPPSHDNQYDWDEETTNWVVRPSE